MKTKKTLRPLTPAQLSKVAGGTWTDGGVTLTYTNGGVTHTD